MRADVGKMFAEEVCGLYAKYGPSAKFVRAFCKLYGLKYTAQGAPAQWYEWWPAIAEALARRAVDAHVDE